MRVHRFPPPSVYGRLRVERRDLGPALWLEQRPPGDGGFGTVAGVCAPGFDAYARILHPALLGADAVRWDRVAAVYGRTVSAGTRWHELIGVEDPFLYRNDDTPAVPGVWDEHPHEGPTPGGVARTLISVLSRHTRTPDHCWYGLWEGYGHYDWDGLPASAHRTATRSSSPALSTTPTPPPATPTRRRPRSPTCGGPRIARGAWAATSTW